MEKCNCIVAWGYEDFYDGAVNNADVFEMATRIKKELIDFIAGTHGAESVKITLYHSQLKASFIRTILNKQIDTFNFCPSCGKRINWEQLHKKWESLTKEIDNGG